MARTARNRIEESPVEQRRYKVGIYARLSVEGTERKNESIDTQIEIAKQFVSQHPEMSIYDIYIDLGATGTNFERAGFQRMLQDVRRRNVDCVIVKDLSRFGRNCVETGNYIQKIFPFMNVRFIAVTEGIDTFDPEHTPDEMTINLKNLVNEMYAKDIAEKVRATKTAQREKGSFLGSVAPYGYEYAWVDNKRILKVEPESAAIVKDIFNLRLEGFNMKQIVETLYKRKIHTPAYRLRTGHVYQQDGEKLESWSRGTVKSILTNISYIGNTICSYTNGTKYKNRELHDVDKEDIEVYQNTHEAIIPYDVFHQVSQSFEESAKYCNKKGFQRRHPIDEDIYQDVIICGDCGKKMTRSSHVKTLSSGDKIRWYGYRCEQTNRLDVKCPAKGISKYKLDELVLCALEQEFKLSAMRPKTVTEECKREAEKEIAILEKNVSKMNALILALNKRNSEIYLQYRMGAITVEEYQKQKQQLSNDLEESNKRIDAYHNEIRNVEKRTEDTCKYLRQLMSCKKKNVSLDRSTINMLIERIEIYAEHRVKIVFAFRMSDLLQKELITDEEK